MHSSLTTKEVVDVQSVDPKLLTEINDKATELLALQAQIAQLTDEFNQQYAQARAELNKQLAPLRATADTLRSELAATVNANRSALIAKGRKSFVTMAAIFQFHSVPGKPKIVNAQSVLDVARTLGAVHKVADRVYPWVLNPKKFFTWLGTHMELQSLFKDAVELPEAYESLTIKPNTGLAKVYSNTQNTPPATPLKGLPRN